MYSVLPYALATGIVEIPYLIMQSVVFTPIFYFMVGFKASAEAFFIFLIIFAQSLTLYTFLGQLLVYLVPTQPLAALLGSLSHTVWTVFNGYLVPRPLMAKGWWWLNYLCGTTWVIYGVGASQLGDVKEPFVPPGGGGAHSLERSRACAFGMLQAAHELGARLSGTCCRFSCVVTCSNAQSDARADGALCCCRLCRLRRRCARQLPDAGAVATGLLWLPIRVQVVVCADPHGVHRHVPCRRNGGTQGGQP